MPGPPPGPPIHVSETEPGPASEDSNCPPILLLHTSLPGACAQRAVHINWKPNSGARKQKLCLCVHLDRIKF